MNLMSITTLARSLSEKPSGAASQSRCSSGAFKGNHLEGHERSQRLGGFTTQTLQIY